MMISTKKAALAITAVVAAALLSLSGCSAGTSGGTSSSDASTAKIGLLLPETTTARYEGKDKPYFEAKLKELCAKCTLLYANANSDASKQQQQALSMLTQGVKVLVIDPFDGVAAASIVEAAAVQKVPVVAYDRLIRSDKLTYSISNDYEKVGALQGKSLVDKLKKDGVAAGGGSGIVMLNGASTDNNAGNIKKGALKEINASGYKVLADISTWDPVEAQNFASSQLTKFGKKVVAFYSANDGNAGGAIAALKGAGLPIVPITGLDASVAGLQAIIAGDQYMTVYNSFKGEADKAAEIAVELANGKKLKGDVVIDGIPTTLQQPVAVSIDNIESTIIQDDFYTVSDLCTATYAAACAAAGIK